MSRFAELFRAFREARPENVQEKEVDKLLAELADMDYVVVSGKGIDKTVKKKLSF
jgi:preprotein translocase subunit YajC